MEALREHRRRPLTVEEVLHLAERGFFDASEPCELLWGDLYTVSPQSHPHAKVLLRLARELGGHFPELEIRWQMPLVAGELSLPEPDIVVCRYTPQGAPERHPNAAEALLVVEVAVTSHSQDRAKAELYAQGGVPAYWLVDVPNRYVEVYSKPLPNGRYGHVDIHPWETAIALPEGRGFVELAQLIDRPKSQA